MSTLIPCRVTFSKESLVFTGLVDNLFSSHLLYILADETFPRMKFVKKNNLYLFSHLRVRGEYQTEYNTASSYFPCFHNKSKLNCLKMYWKHLTFNVLCIKHLPKILGFIPFCNELNHCYNFDQSTPYWVDRLKLRSLQQYEKLFIAKKLELISPSFSSLNHLLQKKS